MQAGKESPRGNCVKGGCACVGPNGAECRRCGFDRGELRRRKALPLEELPNGLMGKRVGGRENPDNGTLEKTVEERVC